MHDLVGPLRQRMAVDLVVANGENAASGLGITPRIARSFFADGVDVITSGNHIWRRHNIIKYFADEPRLLRPANYPPQNPGSGLVIVTTADGTRVAVINLMGRVFMDPVDCPFRVADEILASLPQGLSVILVDFHGEASSEKQALGFYLAGRVSAVVGTHTHVQTADEQVLPGGTAYITDVGMTGPTLSVIGMERERAIERFVYKRTAPIVPASEPGRLHGVLITVDPTNGKALSIQRVQEELDVSPSR